MHSRGTLVELAIEQGAGLGSKEAAARTGGLVQAARLLRFLEVSVADYDEASERFVAHVRRQMAIAQQREVGPRLLEADEVEALEDGETLAAVLHLRIETFYVFGKVLLDQLAHAIECYLGKTEPRIKITKHSELRSKLRQYASEKGLSSPDGLLEQANSLDERVVAFREKHVVHDQSPRSSKATLFDADGRTKIAAGRLFPSDGESSTESEVLHDLMCEIERYVEEVCSYLRENREGRA